MRTYFEYTDEKDCHYLEQCCDPENIISPQEGQSSIVENINEKTIDQCVQKCRADAPFELQKLPPKISVTDETPTAYSCGYRYKHGIGMELTNHSDVAQFGEFPWMLALMELENSSSSYICGGSLIHPSVVLTSAHCVSEKSAEVLLVRAGEWDTQTVNEPFPHTEHTVKTIIINSDFSKPSMHNDLALLVLTTPVKLSAHISTICLPPIRHKFDGNSCFASGWGADEFGKQGAYRINLKKRQLPVIPLKDCQDRLRTTELGEKFKIHPGFMCAGGELGVDTCTGELQVKNIRKFSDFLPLGDGGSPLVCPIPDEVDYFYQAGTVTWGIECGREGIPGVYVNVAKYRKWIDDEMIALGFGVKSYSF